MMVVPFISLIPINKYKRSMPRVGGYRIRVDTRVLGRSFVVRYPSDKCVGLVGFSNSYGKDT